MDDGPLITAVDLLQALEEKRGDFKEDRWAIIQEIIDVREQLEQFSDGSQYCGKTYRGCECPDTDVTQIPAPSFMSPTSVSRYGRRTRTKAMPK